MDWKNAGNIVEKHVEFTDIIASDENVELITTFFTANRLIPGLEVSSYRKVLSTSDVEEDGIYTEKCYQAICLKFERADEATHILLINLASKHHGINNMLVDYLHRLGISARKIQVMSTFPRRPTDLEVTQHFKEKVVPKLGTETNTPLRKIYESAKE